MTSSTIARLSAKATTSRRINSAAVSLSLVAPGLGHWRRKTLRLYRVQTFADAARKQLSADAHSLEQIFEQIPYGLRALDRTSRPISARESSPQ